MIHNLPAPPGWSRSGNRRRNSRIGVDASVARFSRPITRPRGQHARAPADRARRSLARAVPPRRGARRHAPPERSPDQGAELPVPAHRAGHQASGCTSQNGAQGLAHGPARGDHGHVERRPRVASMDADRRQPSHAIADQDGLLQHLFHVRSHAGPSWYTLRPEARTKPIAESARATELQQSEPSRWAVARQISIAGSSEGQLRKVWEVNSTVSAAYRPIGPLL